MFHGWYDRIWHIRVAMYLPIRIEFNLDIARIITDARNVESVRANADWNQRFVINRFSQISLVAPPGPILPSWP